MSNYLSQVTHTKTSQTGQRIVIAGVEGIGKTTLACNAPKVLLIPLETGYTGQSVNKTPMLTKWDEVSALIDEITKACQTGKFQFKTLVFDSATALERLNHERTLQTDSGWKAGNPKGLTMESALGGYGKAYQFADSLFHELLLKLDSLANYGNINIIFTCHVFANKVIDPTAGEYNSWDLLLHSPKNNKNSGKREMLTQWADLVGFLHEPLYVSKNSESFSQGISANKGRILGVERTPSYVAKNRYHLKGELTIPKEQCWNYLADAIFKSFGVDLYNRD